MIVAGKEKKIFVENCLSSFLRKIVENLMNHWKVSIKLYIDSRIKTNKIVDYHIIKHVKRKDNLLKKESLIKHLKVII